MMQLNFAAARRNSPDFGKMAQQAGAIRSKIKQEGINAAAKVTRTGIQTAANVKENEIKIKAKAGLAKSKRKAGALQLLARCLLLLVSLVVRRELNVRLVISSA